MVADVTVLHIQFKLPVLSRCVNFETPKSPRTFGVTARIESVK